MDKVFKICLYVFFFILFINNVANAGDLSNKWRTEVDGGADSDGELVFHITPEDEETIVITVPIKDGTGENRVAKKIRDVFKETLPKDRFKVEVDDGEDVLVKKRWGEKNFALTLESDTVKDTDFDIEKE